MSKSKQETTCEWCVHWWPRGGTGLGECRRRAPTITRGQIHGPGADEPAGAIWPHTVTDDGCGDGKHK